MNEEFYDVAVAFGKVLLSREYKWRNEKERMSHQFPTREQELEAERNFLVVVRRELENDIDV